MPDALELLKIRRSVKPREMSGPGPTADELDTILTIGARVPDHGKLTPWRFIVFEGDARARAGDVIAQVFAKKNPSAPAPTAANVGYEDRLWQMADALRGSMDAAEYKHVCLGLLFLKYISDARLRRSTQSSS